jgi:hypothetical protein
MYSGDTKLITVNISDDNFEDLDITGATLKWVVKRNIRSSTNNILKTTDDGIIVFDQQEQRGRIQIKILPADTEKLSGDFYHEIELTDVQGNVSTVMTGTITIEIDGV